MNEFRTSDIVLAAYLRTNQCTMINIEKQGQKGTFVFEDVPNDLIMTYQLGNASVEPITFNNIIKQLATSIRTIV